MKLSKPFALAHFHPHCAKKYFADKEQPNQNNNSRIKEKILQNLEKMCLVKKIFREHNIREITFKNGKKLITSKSLGLGISNSNSQSNQNNHQLAIGLAVGGVIAAVILIGVVYSLASKKKNKL